MAWVGSFYFIFLKRKNLLLIPDLLLLYFEFPTDIVNPCLVVFINCIPRMPNSHILAYKKKSSHGKQCLFGDIVLYKIYKSKRTFKDYNHLEALEDK